MPDEIRVVVCSLEPWGEVRRRMQILVGVLADSHGELKFLYVEPPVDVPHAIKNRQWDLLARRKPPSSGKVTVFRPRKWLPRVVGPYADRSLCRQVRKSAAKIPGDPTILWINDAHYAMLLEQTRWKSVYDVTDDWLHSSLTPRELKRLENDDRHLVERCDEVVVCSEDLARSRGQNRKVELISNGVDLEMFTNPGERPADLPAGVTAVYVGSLHEDRLDLDLTLRLADEIRQLQIVLVGPSSLGAEAEAKLKSRSNVHLLGSRPYAQVPAYMHHADVIVIPHVVSKFTESLDPIKAYEVMAVGRPTVATPVAGFRHLGPPVVIASPDTFVDAVRKATAITPDDTTVPRGTTRQLSPDDDQSRTYSATSSWSDRAEQMARVFQRAIAN